MIYKNVEFEVILKNEGYWWRIDDFCSDGPYRSQEEACNELEEYVDWLLTKEYLKTSYN